MSSILYICTARNYGGFVALSDLKANTLLLFTNQAYVQRTHPINKHCHISHFQSEVFSSSHPQNQQTNQNEAHPPPHRHDGALLQPRARRPKQGPIEIRQERCKVKGQRSVSNVLFCEDERGQIY